MAWPLLNVYNFQSPLITYLKNNNVGCLHVPRPIASAERIKLGIALVSYALRLAP